MANEKQAKFIIDVSAEKKRTRNSSVRFFSKDRQTAKLLIQAEKDKIAISKNLISRVEILLESVNASYIPDGKVIYNDLMAIESDGLFSYTLTDELLNYSGLMAFEIYIYYLSGEQSDSSNRIIYEQRVSAIDRNAGQVELVYLKDMEAAKREVALAAAETITNITGFYSGLDTYSEEKKDEMDAFSTSVGNLASAEKLKIQAELTTVQQISTSETTKIKAELPAVQAVATAEIGKITAVLPTVENAATEVSNYADQKIIEYDAKFTQSNQKMNDLQQSQTALTTKLTETQQKITDSDVFMKAESSANVVYQVIGKDVVEMTVTLDFKNKIAGSNVENLNAAKYGGGASLFPPTAPFKEYDTSAYRSIDTLDSKNKVNTVSSVGGMAQLVLEYDVLGTLKKILGEHFFSDRGASTIAEQVAILNGGLITNFVSKHSGFGESSGGNKISMACRAFDSNSWINAVSHTSNAIASLTISTDYVKNKISDTGFSNIIIYSEANDGTKISQISTDYTSLEIKIRISANEHIKSMIANYNRTLVAQFNDLAGRVSALESN